MKTRREEVHMLLDALNAEILQKFPEGPDLNNWLHNAIAKKVELEIEMFKNA